MPDRSNEYATLLKNAVQGALNAYTTNLVFGGKADQDEEKWIAALFCGMNSILLVEELQQRLSEVEKERDALKRDLCTSCPACKHWVKYSCTIHRSIPYECEPCDGYEWRGVDHDKR